MFGIPLEYLITYIVRMMTMVNKRTVVDGNLDGTGGKKKTMSTAKRLGQGVKRLSEKAQKQIELERLRDIQVEKNINMGNRVKRAEFESKYEGTVDSNKRGGKIMKKKGYKKGGMMKKKGYSKGGMMKKKGYAMGGMMKKGYAAGGFPDLNKDGEVTQADILQGRGVKKMSKGGMAKKGYAMGGMMKKGYAKGGPTKKKSTKKDTKKGGKVRGVRIAKKGFRPAKMR